MTKRIALISEHASPLGILGGVDSGGQNVYVGELARHMVTIGYDVDVFTRRDSDLLPEVTEWVNGVRIVHVPAGPPEYVRKESLLPYMEEFTSQFTRFLKKQRKAYDLIHANFWMSGMVAAEVKRMTGMPFVITFHALGRVRRLHQGDADEFPDRRFDIEDRIIAEADHIIAECPQDEEDLIRLYNADPARITIVPGGFSQTEFFPISKALARVALGFAPEDRIVLQLGRMVPRKGIDNVIRGHARLWRDHQIQARLVIVGGNSEKADAEITPEIGRLQAIASEEGHSDHVDFIGRRGRESLKYYYSAADVFVTTPWYEPFGITPLEAMACGTPVVGAKVGGIQFTVRDSETGYLVPPNDPGALAERIAHLYQHPKLLGLFRKQAIRRANDLFTWQKVAAAIASIYEEVLAANQPERSDEANNLAIIDGRLEATIEALLESKRRLRRPILDAVEMISNCLAQGGKLLICGNGGSAADAQHFATELVGQFKDPDRPGLPAIALNADTTFLTAWANDVGYESALARQVYALGKEGDVLIGISTSGRSRNIVEAFKEAKRKRLWCVALSGGDGGDIRQLADLSVIVPSPLTPHIQEVHIVVIHILCHLVEESLVSGRLVAGSSVPPVPVAWELPRRRCMPASRRSRSYDASSNGNNRLESGIQPLKSQRTRSHA